MANTISTTLAINDNMSKAFQSMNKSINLLISSFETLERSSSNAIDTTSLSQARRYINDAQRAFEEVDETIDRVRESTNDAGKSQDLFRNKVKSTNSAADGLRSTFIKIGAAIGAALSGKQLIELSDTMSQTKARLDLMNDGMQTTGELQQMIAQAAKNSRGS